MHALIANSPRLLAHAAWALAWPWHLVSHRDPYGNVSSPIASNRMFVVTVRVLVVLFLTKMVSCYMMTELSEEKSFNRIIGRFVIVDVGLLVIRLLVLLYEFLWFTHAVRG